MKKRHLILAILVVFVAMFVIDQTLKRTSRAAPVARENGDVNGDLQIDLADPVFLLNFIFRRGPAPVAIAGSPDLEERVALLEREVQKLQSGLDTPNLVTAALRAVEILLDEPGLSERFPSAALDEIGCAAPNPPTNFVLVVDGKRTGDVVGFHGREEISANYRFDIVVRLPAPSLNVRTTIGVPAQFLLTQGPSQTSYDGIVTRARLVVFERGKAEYVLTLEPAVFSLAEKSDSRIFQGKTIPQTVQQVLGENGFQAMAGGVAGMHPARDCLVQYNETYLDFIRRALEEEGIFYYFRTSSTGVPELVLGDRPTAYTPVAGGAFAYYGHNEDAQVPGEEYVTSFSPQSQLVPGKYAHTDYNFETPSTDLETSADSIVNPDTNLEIYDYPGEYAHRGDGDTLARTRMEEREVAANIATGTSNAGAFRPGHTFSLTDVAGAGFQDSYALISVEHVGFLVDQGAATCSYYANSFTCLPDSVTFRPARSTPKPFVRGVQTATVVGPSGQEIHTDEFGRVKVQFHWDREGVVDETSSCWIRVSQVHAGENFGAIDIPRIGQEVIVDFLEGNPDRSIVTGRVYNAEVLPPYALPDEQNISGMKSNSTPGGGGFNEIVMDDTKGSELIRMHGQFDMDMTVQNDMRMSILHDMRMDVTNDMGMTATNDVAVEAGNGLVLRSGAGVLLDASDTQVSGRMTSLQNAGAGGAVLPGWRYRDNTITAWARVEADGSVGSDEFGVASVTRTRDGAYDILVSAPAASAEQLIPVVTPLVGGQPRTLDDIVFASVQQANSLTFRVFTNNTLGPVDAAFTFMVTSR